MGPSYSIEEFVGGQDCILAQSLRGSQVIQEAWEYTPLLLIFKSGGIVAGMAATHTVPPDGEHCFRQNKQNSTIRERYQE